MGYAIIILASANLILILLLVESWRQFRFSERKLEDLRGVHRILVQENERLLADLAPKNPLTRTAAKAQDRPIVVSAATLRRINDQANARWSVGQLEVPNSEKIGER